MEKDSLTSLISRDLNELRQLVDGFLQMSSFPEPLVRLAADKAKTLSDNLLKLNELPKEMRIVDPQLETPWADEPSEEPDVEVEIVIDDEPIEEEEVAAEEEEEVAEPVMESVEPQPMEMAEETQPVAQKKTLLADLMANSVANTVGQVAIDDLSKAIPLVDRFRFIRELFGGNGELMNTTIDDLNQCASVDEVNDYLMGRFPKWDTDNEAVVAFLSIVSRKFL